MAETSPDPFFTVNCSSGQRLTVLFNRLLFFHVKPMSGRILHEFFYEGVEKPATVYPIKDHTEEITQAYQAWYNSNRRTKVRTF